MTDPTRTTGATDDRTDRDRCMVCGARLRSGFQDFCIPCWDRVTNIAERNGWRFVTPDRCIVPRSFVAAVDAAISEAEELDYSPPYVRIPLGAWHDLENARDTFREGK